MIKAFFAAYLCLFKLMMSQLFKRTRRPTVSVASPPTLPQIATHLPISIFREQPTEWPENTTTIFLSKETTVTVPWTLKLISLEMVSL